MADISFDYFDHPQNKQVRYRLSISVLSLSAYASVSTVYNVIAHTPWYLTLGHYTLYATCHAMPISPSYPPHLTSPSPHLSPLISFEQSTTYSLHKL
jgi:hypothetical protein